MGLFRALQWLVCIPSEKDNKLTPNARRDSLNKKPGVEYIKVFIDYKDGKTVCICKRDKKRCNKRCTPDVVERDKYRGWEDTFHVDKYGKSKG